jgi:hypothetical protein
LRKLHTDFHSYCTNLHPTNSVQGLLSSPHPCPHLLLVFLMIPILTMVRWNFTVILICISFIAKDLEHFFTSLLATYTSLENCLLNYFPHLLIRLFVLLMFNLWSSLCILDINAFPWIVDKNFLQFCRLFLLLWRSFFI